MFVANRGIGKQGSVTKIANDPSSCIDRNGNGTIETSRDINGDGQISTAPARRRDDHPHRPGQPEHLRRVRALHQAGGRADGGDVAGRALAVSAGAEGTAGDVWAGIYFEQRMYKLNSANGELMPVSPGGPNYVQIGFGPYGAIVDRLQRLWVVMPGTARLALIDTLTGTLISDTIQNTAECAAYGIGIDGKNRVWLPGWTLGASACRYDHTTGTWTKFDFTAARSPQNTAFAWGRGIAVDTSNRVFMSGYSGSAAQLIRFDAETGAIIPFAGRAVHGHERREHRRQHRGGPRRRRQPLGEQLLGQRHRRSTRPPAPSPARRSSRRASTRTRTSPATSCATSPRRAAPTGRTSRPATPTTSGAPSPGTR